MSHAKIGRFSKKQIFELPDGTHRLEPHLYVRVRGNGRYRNYFFRYLDPKGRVCDLALGSASKKPLSEVKQFAFLLKTSLQFSGKASALMEAKHVNFQRFPTLDAKKLVNAPKMSAHHRGICHF